MTDNNNDVKSLIKRTIYESEIKIKEGNPHFAEALLKQLSRICELPDEAKYKLAVSLHQQNKNKEVVEYLKEKIEGETDDWKSLNLAGVAFSSLHQHKYALSCFEKSLDLNPIPIVRGNIALEHQKLGQLDKAKKELKKAMESPSPHMATLMFNYGNILMDDLNPKEASKWFSRVESLMPDFVSATWNKAIALLSSKQYEKGWDAYESRWNQFPNFDKRRKNFAWVPLWVGQSLKGKVIYLYAEQGAGDAIQFLRFVKRIKELGAFVVVEWNAAFEQGDLIILLKELSFVDDVVNVMEDQNIYTEENIDYHQSIFTIPRILKIYDEKEMKCNPYIKSNKEFSPELDDHHWERYNDKFKIGLVWFGSRFHPRDERRSLKVSEFDRIFNLSDKAHFFGLQRGNPKRLRCGEEVDLNEGIENYPIVDLNPLITDYNSTANLISKMNLIVSVDTSLVHLSGAMGKDTFVLLQKPPDWRWGVDSEKTIWYDSITLFRQDKIDDWSDPIDRLYSQIKEKINAWDGR